MFSLKATEKNITLTAQDIDENFKSEMTQIGKFNIEILAHSSKKTQLFSELNFRTKTYDLSMKIHFTAKKV